MASDDAMTVLSSMHEEDDDDDDHLHNPSQTMSRLAFCTSNSQHSMFDDDDDDDMIMDMSRLYVESEEEEEEEEEEVDGELSGKEGSMGSETGWFSLPGSPFGEVGREVREYASENEGKREERRGERMLSVRGQRWVERAWEMRKCKAADEEMESSNGNNYPSGESESVVIARPKGGGRCLCMDLEEVKACRELGFDLQHEWTLEIPTRFSPSSAADTDSGGNSPITNWKISSAGDDPKDVKARLKVWAQAVALASTHRLTG